LGIKRGRFRMRIEATNNFRYRTITLDGQNYLIDAFPKWYMIFFGVFSIFSSLYVYPITESEKESIERRIGILDKVSIGAVPLIGGGIGILINSTTGLISGRLGNFGGNSSLRITIIAMVIVLAITYCIWRERQKNKMSKVIRLVSTGTAARAKIHRVRVRGNSKIYFSVFCLEMLFQGLFCLLTIIFLVNESIKLDLDLLVAYSATAFMYFFVMAFIPDKMIENIEVKENSSWA